jgi:hypothetical protein
MTKFTKEHRAKLSAAAKARYAKGKKRGRKPGVKVGRYRTKNNPSKFKINWDALSPPIDGPIIPKYSPTPILTLCGQLEDSILLLENRISNAIAKINSLM